MIDSTATAPPLVAHQRGNQTPLICDVAPRDGLQIEETILAPERRAHLCRLLAGAGLRRVEAVSFVHPGLVPTMAGAEEVLALLGDSEDTEWTGLILNERGFDRALAAGLRRINLTVGSTDTFCQRNQGCTRSEAEDLVRTVGERARAESIQLTVSLAVAFGCPFEGRVAVGKVQELADIAAEAGADEIVCADTIGVAGPGAVRRLITLVAAGPIRVGGHFHDTRNTGIANCLAALDAGATLLDASVGGVGGCPFAPGATGNVGTEDLLYVLEEEGIATGIDIEAVLDCSRWLSKQLGHAASSSLSRAGVFRAGQVGASSAS